MHLYYVHHFSKDYHLFWVMDSYLEEKHYLSLVKVNGCLSLVNGYHCGNG